MKRSIIITSLTLAMLAQAGIVKAYKTPDGKSGGSGSDKSLAAGCLNPENSAVLELNNVRTTIYSGGDMWWDLKSFARYEIPKGSGKHSLYLGTLWIGGTDINGQLKVAAQRYRANGPDYYTGPLDTLGTAEIDAATCKEFDKIWKITRAEAALHRACTAPGPKPAVCDGYQTPESIKNWPAITYKQNDLIGGLPSVQYFYAPFIDVDGDMAYNPEQGDYPGYDLDNVVDCQRDRTPYLYGDLTLYWIFNDKGNIHYETQSTPIGMEVRAQAFSFATNDEVNNMTFYNYELVNRGTTTLFNCYFGVNTDADLGYAFDDYAGCDVLRGFGYVYNGDAIDAQGSNPAPDQYGANPPAIGIDFFEGPYADPDGIANAFDPNDVSTWLAINGVGYGDTIKDNERIGMRRFIYYSNTSGPIGDPENGKAIQYYNYLRGYWKNSARMVFGGSGFPGAQGATTITADFMFPGDSDPYNWGTQGANPGFQWTQQNPCPSCPQASAADQRFVQSAGPFTLLPGAVNDITTGAVWARAFSGDPFESVNLVRKADDKAQQLFENCFRLLDGPDAPDVYLQELDRELIVYWTNTSLSNNYLNQYEELDYSIDTSVATTVESRKYKFEGYLVYQVTGPTVTSDQRHDLTKARLIAQCDLKNFSGTGTANPIGTLINYTPDQDLGFNVPQVEVQGANAGIFQSLRVTEDAFATGADKRLVNNKQYYFLVIAYGYNNYKKYDQNDPMSLDGQKKPFISSRKSSTGAITIYSGIPHITAPEAGGTIINSFYGDVPEITRIEGNGNGGNAIDITKESEAQILANNYVSQVTYQRGRGPIKIKVVDPLSIEKGTYYVAIDGPVNSGQVSTLNVTSRWALLNEDMDTVVVSDANLSIGSEQILFDKTGKFTGLSLTVRQVEQPGENREANNGFIEATIEIEHADNVYLGFVPDDDVVRALNWILSGNQTLEQPVDAAGLDPDQVYERIALGQGGALAPYKLASYMKDAPAWAVTIPPSVSRMDYLQSIDLVLTPDKSKWTRVPVLETDSIEAYTYTHPDLANVKPRKLDLRRSPSVDKEGRYATSDGTVTGSLLTTNSSNPEDASYINAWGMGWFPGYAVSVETGERLNMAFGEDSYLAQANGRDMLFNPIGIDLNKPNDISNIISSFGDAILGGKHFIYVFGSNSSFSTSFPATPRYDAGVWAMNILTSSNGRPADVDKRQLFRSAMWTGIPVSLIGRPWLGEEMRVRMRVTKPYTQFSTYANDPAPAPVNNNKPLYKFSLDGLAPTTGDVSTARSAMDLINVVPNPYYAYSAYEVNQLDNRIKITNLPPECTITIYNTAGSLIRRYTKSDNRVTSVDWDLKNFANIPISSGIYIIHVKAPGIGERVIKWFGVLRPTDVSDF